MELLYDRLYSDECREVKTKHEAECKRLTEEARQSGKEDTLDLPTLQLPTKRNGLAGGGSLSAAGQTASQAQHRNACVAIEPELQGILGWLSQELAVDSAVAAKIWDNTTWDRPVMCHSKQLALRRGSPARMA